MLAPVARRAAGQRNSVSSGSRSPRSTARSTSTQAIPRAAASTLDPEIRAQKSYGGNKAAASVVGRVIAERAKQAGIDKICFDRRSYKYHGRVEALARAAREAGLQF